MVEVIVAMAVLIIGIVALLPMLALNIRANVSSRTYSIANYLAQEKLERVRSWPMYEDQSNALRGITAANLELFNTEVNLTLNDWKVFFDRQTELVHNGYSGGACTNGYIYGVNIDEGNFNNGSSIGLTLNTGNVNPCAGGGYSGEDFKLVRVSVSWNDVFGFHEIVRHMFISKF
jgi:type II secretory pathway pseudopilin PulG